jgi:hypothetical protein
MIAAPVGWPAAIAGFVLFRAFDIVNHHRRAAWSGCWRVGIWPTISLRGH